MSRIAVVVVNYNTCEHLYRCLQSIPDRNSLEVIVVDNASTDGSLEMVRRNFPEVRLLVNRENTGYGAAANRAMEKTTAEYILLLNSDTCLEPDTVEVLRAYLDNHPLAAVVGPRLVHPDGCLQPSCYPFPTLFPLFLQETGLERLLARLPFVQSRSLRAWPHDRPRVVPWLLGAALTIRRTAFQAVGGFDEGYFMYLEEIDLCYRLGRWGWEVHFAPQTTVVHVGGGATDQRRTEMKVAYFRSVNRFYRSHFKQPAQRLLPLMVKLIVSARLIRDSYHSRRENEPPELERLNADVSAWRQILHESGAFFETGRKKEARPGKPDMHSPARRLDWRYLLPHPPDGTFDHLLLLGAPDENGRSLLQSGIARHVHTSPDHQSEAVVALDGAGIPVEQGAAAVKPGGMLYYEVDRRRPGQRSLSPERMARTLDGLGLTPLAFYWVMPDFQRRKRYIPLEPPEAFHWYVDTLFLAGRPLHRLFEMGLRLYRRMQGRRFAPLSYCYAVVACAGDSADYVPSIFGHPAFPLPRPADLRPVMMTSGQDRGSRVVLLPFVPGKQQPAYVVKIAPLLELNDNTRREQTSLRQLQDSLEPVLRDSLPTPLGAFHYGELTVSAESCAPGRPLSISSGRWGVSFQEQIDDLRLGAEWLASFHRGPAGKRVLWDKTAVDRWVDGPITEFERHFSTSRAQERLFSQIRKRAEALRGLSLPLVRMHYDFGPWNLYRTGDKLIVIDWEFGRDWERDQLGPALCDLLYLTNYWIHLVRHTEGEAAELQGFHDFFIAPNLADRQVRAAHEVLTAYMDFLDLDRRYLPVLLLFTWMEQAVHQRCRRLTLGGDAAEADGGNRCAAYIRLLAAHQEKTVRMDLNSPERAAVNVPSKDQRISRRIVVGTASNYAGQIIAYVTLFFLTPFILRELGAAEYGLWVLVGSIVAYGSLLDLGIWATVIKYVSEFLARDEPEKARQLVGTALWLYVGLGAGVFVLVALAAPSIPLLFNVAAGQEEQAVQLTLLMGLAAAVSLPGMAPLAALRGLQRYELVNLVEIVGAIFSAVGSVAALLAGGGVINLMMVSILSVLLMHLLALGATRWMAGELGLGWHRPNRDYVRLVLGYSWPLFVKDVATRLQTKTDELTIGALLAVTAVTPYSLTKRLGDATLILTRQFMKVLLPLASELDAENDRIRLRLLYTAGTRLGVAISLVIGVTLMVLARPILTVWIGPEYSGYSGLVIILATTNLIITSQWPAMAVLQGMSLHRLLAVTSFTSGVANLALSILLAHRLGLVGVALGTLIPAALEHLGVIMPYTMRILDVKPGEALKEIYGPALLPAVPMALVQITLLNLLTVDSLPTLILVAAAGAIVYGITYLSFGTTAAERKAYRTLASDMKTVAVTQLRR